MRTPKLTRAQRRRLRKLADPIRRIRQGDLNYFSRFPHRRHRVREADCAETRTGVLARGKELAPAKLKTASRGQEAADG